MRGESTCASPAEGRANGRPTRWPVRERAPGSERAHGRIVARRRASSLLCLAVVAAFGCDGDPSLEPVSSTSSAATASPRAADARDAATGDAASGAELDSPPTEERPFREGAPDLEALVATYQVPPHIVSRARAFGDEEGLHEALAFRWTEEQERARRVDGFRAAIAAANVRDQRAIATADSAATVQERRARRATALVEALRVLETEAIANGEVSPGATELSPAVRDRASALVRLYSRLHPDDEAEMIDWLRAQVQRIEPTEGDRRASAELRAALEAMGADSAATMEVE